MIACVWQEEFAAEVVESDDDFELTGAGGIGGSGRGRSGQGGKGGGSGVSGRGGKGGVLVAVQVSRGTREDVQRRRRMRRTLHLRGEVQHNRR